jgi:hypothetical protein
MALERFIPKSPDIFIRNSQDFEVAKFGHLNTIVEYINNNSAKPAGLNGYVQFNNNSALGGDAGLFWDNVNKRLGIGTVTPSSTLIVNGVTGITNSLYLGNTDSFLSTNRFQILNAANSAIMVNVDNGGSISTTGRFQIFNSARTAIAQAMYYDGGTMVFRPMNDGVESTSFRNNAQTLNILNFNGVNGNVDLNFTGASLGAKLGIKGSGSTSATTSLLVQNSAGTAALTILDDRTSTFGNNVTVNTASGGVVQLGNSTTSIFRIVNTYERINIQPISTGGTLSLNTGTEAGVSYSANDSGHVFAYPFNRTAQNTFSIDRPFFGNVGATTKTMLSITTTNISALSNATLLRGIYFAPTTTDWASVVAFESTAGNVIINGGNVGIGTSNPISKLNVVTPYSALNTDFIFSNSDTTNAPASLSYSSFTSTLRLNKAYSSVKVTNFGGNADVAIFGSGGPAGLLQLNQNGGSSNVSLSGEAAGYSYFLTNVGFGLSTTPTAKLQIKGSGSTSATTSLLVQNSGGTQLLSLNDAGTSVFGGKLNVTTGGMDVTGTALFQNSITCYDTIFCNGLNLGNFQLAANPPLKIYYGLTSTGQVIISPNNTYTAQTSAALQVEGYDVGNGYKGFLPPRMTNAQRAAIGTPAVGLMVYCTDAVEGLYVYKSTGWTFVI